MESALKSNPVAQDNGDQVPSWREVFFYFLTLGFINVGGPVAQITMMYNHMVERHHWLSDDRFVRIMAFCHMLPGPEALQLAIYVGYLKKKLVGGILAGLTFVLPGALIMIALSWIYVAYSGLPQVNDVLYVLKPAVLGIIAAGILKLGRASIRNYLLAALLIAAFVGLKFAGINFLLILVLPGIVNLLIAEGWPKLWNARATLPAIGVFISFFPFVNLSLELLPAALLDVPTIVIALIAFLVITAFKVDVAKVALGGITSGVLFAVAKGLWASS